MVSVQSPRPSHARSAHTSESHVYVVDTQLPLTHTSPNEHAFPSLQLASVERHPQPPTLVHVYLVPPHVTSWHSVWFAPLHGCDVPSEHVPAAPAPPHPWQLNPVIRFVEPHVSGHAVGAVKQPPGAQPAAQHPDAVHVLSAGVQLHVSQSPSGSHVLVHVASA
jgi:hypothetical protein